MIISADNDEITAKSVDICCKVRIKLHRAKDNLLVALKNIPNNKTLENDGLYKEFYKIIWEDVKDTFINSLKQVKIETN